MELLITNEQEEEIYEFIFDIFNAKSKVPMSKDKLRQVIEVFGDKDGKMLMFIESKKV